jgi:hypothetical protein
MSRISFLRKQIALAERIAAAMMSSSERERFQSVADKYQAELDALLSAEAQSEQAESPDTSPPQTASSPERERDAIASKSQPDPDAPPDAVAATNDGDATTSNGNGQQETD